MVTTSTHLRRMYPVQQELDEAIGEVLSSDTDFGEVSIYDLSYAIVHRIDYVFKLGLELHRNALNTATRLHAWTPVHFAVIAGNEEALEALIVAGADLNAVDKSGWTPLHHAMLLRHVKQIKMLIDAETDPTLESLTGGTCEDVLRCLAPPYMEDSTPIPLLGESGDERLTHGEFKKLTGATFILETHLTPELMFKEWEDAAPHEAMLPFEADFSKQYRRFCANPPIHRLKKVVCDSRGDALVSSPGMGLYANQNYKCGQMIGEYRGLFTAGDVVNAYTLAYTNEKGVNALTHRNEIPQINDGFINVVLIPGRCIAGLSVRDLFVTADEIREGEQFCWNYGYVSRLKIGFPYAELRPKEAREFIKKHKLSELVACLNKLGDKSCSFEEFIKAEKFRYILETPSVIFLMIFDGTISVEEGQELMALSVSMKCISMEEITPITPLLSVARDCIEMRKQLVKVMPSLTNNYTQWITSLPSRAGLLFGFEMAQKVNAFLTRLIKMRSAGEASGDLLTYWEVLEETQTKEINKHLSFVSLL